MNKWTLFIVIPVLFVVSISCYSEDQYVRPKNDFWFSLASAGIDSGISFFATKESEMYEIRGFMQQNPELAAMVNAAYANWQYVIVNESNANLYNEFFGILLPRMQQVMTEHSNQTGVLIDEHTYNLAMSIISEHSNVTDPGFLMLKEQIVTDLNVLKGRNYEAVRAWFRGELY